MSRRGVAFVLACVVAVVIGGAAIGLGRRNAAEAARPTAATAADLALDVATVRAGGYIAFRSTALGPTYGRLAVVPLAAPGGPRAVTSLECDRAYVTRAAGLCLSAARGAVTTYRATLLDAALSPRRGLPLAGIPSRARLSAAGTLAATTTFVGGHSYAQAGFSTATTVHSVAAGKDYGNLEDFAVIRAGKRYRSADLNIWGVTFGTGARFYATVGTKGRTYLAEGDLGARRLTTLRENAECPSLSPDGTRVAYKTRPDPAQPVWRLAVLDLATGVQTDLAETRNVDDQVEWLDDHRILYGLPAEGAATDVWVVPADGSGRPEILIPNAWSPSVVR